MKTLAAACSWPLLLFVAVEVAVAAVAAESEVAGVAGVAAAAAHAGGGAAYAKFHDLTDQRDASPF